MSFRGDDVLVLGAGLAGLSAGLALARAGREVQVVESQPAVGGLARTVAHGPFRFDLGGHRFFTDDPEVDAVFRGLLGPEALEVARSSRILLRGRSIAYPLRPLDALSGLGATTAARIALDVAAERLRGRFRRRAEVSLEDWVVSRFGRTLFELYFRDYSEKVWGLGCDRISRDWVARRIQGLSVGAAVWNAFTRRHRREVRTLADRFLYPARGIGRLSERLREEIERAGQRVSCGAEVARVRHQDGRVRAVVIRDGAGTATLEAGAFVSTVPLPDLVRMLEPRPPAEVLHAAASLRFRDLVVVAVMLDRRRATDQSWLYFPERAVPFGRIHEPTNWSPEMAPDGSTVLVAEHFCFRGDATWSAGDGELRDRTVAHLHRLGVISRREVLGAAVARVPKAYPLFEVGYAAHRATLGAWLGRLRNLFTAGRGGTFSYHNMDHAIGSGMAAARRALEAPGEARGRTGTGAEAARRSA